jgi:hypothetical protein
MPPALGITGQTCLALFRCASDQPKEAVDTSFSIREPHAMGEIIGAGIVAHAPTIMMSQQDRYDLNEGKEISLVPGLHRLKREVLDVLRPDTIVLFDTHWFTIVEFCVTAHGRRSGLFTSDELPRGMRQIPYDLKGSPALAQAMADKASACGVRTTANDDPCLPIHYPTVNLSTFLQGEEEWVSVRRLPNPTNAWC